jgi:hypothetical protein
LKQVRPQIDTDFKLKPNETAVFFNSLTLDRFERIYSEASQEEGGQVLIPKLGMALVNQKHLEHSMSTQTLAFKESHHGYIVENRYYKIQLDRDGSIHSWKDKRTKNFERELCRPKDRLNKLSIH